MTIATTQLYVTVVFQTKILLLRSALRSSTGFFYWVVDQLTGTIVKTAGVIYVHGHHPHK
jgi:hypothetical protein